VSVVYLADCPVPVLNGKFILSTESIQMNTFPEGSKAFVECPKGQERKEGSNVITCTNGIWSTVELICKSNSFLIFELGRSRLTKWCPERYML